MSGKSLLAALLFFSFLVSVCAQQTQPPPQPSPTPPGTAREDDQEVVRITTNLVQVDAVVTKDGRQVTDLKAEDFELSEDGKPQTITNFSYISNVPMAAAATTPRPSAKDKKGPPVIPAVVHPQDPRRTIALLVDDLGMSFDSIVRARNQIRKYLDELAPNDLVAIIRTGGDVGALQQFTNDRRLLQSAVDRVRWNPCSRTGLHVFPPAGAIGSNNVGLCSPTMAGGTFKSLRFILRGMSYLPGRKSMVVFSDNIPIQDQEPSQLEQDNSGASSQGSTGPRSDSESRFPESGFSNYSQLQRIAELAIRSSVVIYAVDTRGLQYTGLTAADRITAPGGLAATQQINSILSSRSASIFRNREGSDLIARQTGGFLVRNSNDFGLKRVMEDQQGYYLIGFRPNEETFDRKFHRLNLKLKRNGFTVRTRAGFYGYTEEDARTPELTTPDRMNKALVSPFGANEIPLGLSSFFVDEAGKGSLLRSFIYLDPRTLTFTEEAEGWRVATIDLRSILFGDNGRIMEEQGQTATLRLRPEAYARALREGIVYGFDLPTKRRGAFQFRVAVRDQASSHIGATGQFVEIPDLRNGRLTLSGLVIKDGANLGAENDPDAASAQASSGEVGEAVSGRPSLHRFHRHGTVVLAYAIYNAGAERPAPLKLSTQTRIFRDGKLVFTGDPTPLSLESQPDQNRLITATQLQLGSDLGPGDYVLQIIVTDSASQKPRVATQWVDFEVIK